MRPDQLPAIAAFARVAHHGSFTRAAAELGISPSALSQTVRALEQQIGARLLNRTTRSVGLTEIGAQFLARLVPGLEMIGDAFGAIDDVRGRPSGTLRITLPRISAALLISPLLGELHQALPDVRFEFSLDDTFVDLVAGGFDAGIRLGEMLQQDMVAVPVSREQRQLVVGSPQYFAAHPLPRTPEELAAHDCVAFRYVGAGGIYRWEFERDGKEIEIEPKGRLVVNDYLMMIEAARQGLGLALAFESCVAREVAAGTLVSVLEEYCVPFPGFYLYYPAREHLPLKLRVFADFLRAKLQS